MAGLRSEKTRQDYTPPTTLIYFHDRDELNWWDWLFRTRVGFRHCFVIQWCEWSQRWLMIDWRQSRTDLDILFTFEVEAHLRGLHHLKGTVVEMPARKLAHENGTLITYCSNVIPRFLGLRNKWILTPYGLYRMLLKSGGEVVYSWSDENEQEAQANGTTEAA